MFNQCPAQTTGPRNLKFRHYILFFEFGTNLLGVFQTSTLKEVYKGYKVIYRIHYCSPQIIEMWTPETSFLYLHSQIAGVFQIPFQEGSMGYELGLCIIQGNNLPIKSRQF